MLPISHVLRLARRLSATWRARVGSTDPVQGWTSLENHFQAAQYAYRQVRLAASRNLSLALPPLTGDLCHYLGQLGHLAEQLRIAFATPRIRVPDLCDWVRELRQLESEFGTVEIRWSDRVLRAVSEPIVLRDVSLGPFAIDFHWDRDRHSLGSGSFEVIALEPNPPAGREDVTHPHVRDGSLCAGDATEPLRKAVANGRLVDAFLLVRAVLVHYNPHSPHVPLSEWDGFACADCQARGDRDERYSCEGCDCDICGECVLSCSACSASRCADCLSPCDRCLVRHCPGCLLADAHDRALCPDCRASAEAEQPADSTPEPEEDETNDVSRSTETANSESVA